MGERITCSLKEILDFLEMNPNQLYELTKIRRKTIYDMQHNNVKTIKLENVIIILDVLNEQAEKNHIKKRFNTQDLFPYIHKK
ncbi:helix-turn-helix domain-containing protein [Priestia aryabhattai]|uniref:helix-turn-helix domain-containing protein n=1 Tax=Priestia aryabhattai TaxID=412384 RepID=UPI003CA9092A